jgi:phosphate transport system permease protein
MNGAAVHTESRFAPRRVVSAAMMSLSVGFSVGIVALLVLVLWYLVSLGFRGLSWDFFTRVPTGDLNDPGGMKHAIVGTLVLIAMASLVGVPMGVLTGVYLSEYGHERWLATPTRFIADVLAGVPSIVVGVLGYELLVVPLGGYNAWAGAFALAFIMVPIVARTTEEMLRLVPGTYREASLALGASKSQTILRVVLPAATGSIITGVMLALARIAGETAPLLFTVLGSRFMPLWVNSSPPYVHAQISRPFPSLTVQIFTYATGPYETQRRLAWAGILVLIGMLLVINLAVRAIAARMVRRTTG